MSNDHYNHGNAPATSSNLSSATIRAEFDAITAGFDKQPTLTANGGKVVKVNTGGTALEASAVISDDGTNATIAGDAIVAGGNIGVDADSLHALPNVAADTFTLNAATQTLTNKTLTTPVISAPTGLVKADVGLGNVDNTSNATERAATATLTNKTIALGSNTVSGTLAQFNTAVTDADLASITGIETLTNKTLTAPVVNSPTGIVKADVGLSNVDNTSNVTERAATATLTNKTVNLTSNTLSGTTTQFNAALSDGDFATLAGVETLTNKALNGTLGATTPAAAVVTTLSATGNVTLGDASTDQHTINGNIGLGVTPSAWSTLFKVMDIGAAGSIVTYTATPNISINYNTYYAAGSIPTYKTTNVSAGFSLGPSGFVWSTAPSGGAGTTATITEAMRLTIGRKLLIGTTTENTSGAVLQVVDGVTFPATPVASTDPNTLENYLEATFTATATGMTTSPTGTVGAVRNGNAVTLSLPSISGTSNATTFTLTGMPTTLYPSTSKNVLCIIRDNGGAFAVAMANIGSAGVITLYKDTAASAFTASGAKAIYNSQVTYII